MFTLTTNLSLCAQCNFFMECCDMNAATNCSVGNNQEFLIHDVL